MTAAQQIPSMTHAKRRAMQRVPGVCPGRLIKRCVWAVINQRNDVAELIMSVRSGMHLYRSRTDGGAVFYFIATALHIVTFLTPGMTIRHGNIRYLLADGHLEKLRGAE